MLHAIGLFTRAAPEGLTRSLMRVVLAVVVVEIKAIVIDVMRSVLPAVTA
jgi:hypothetical protein